MAALLLITGVSFAGFAGAQSDAPNDQIKTLVKALTKFGDRREGADRQFNVHN